MVTSDKSGLSPNELEAWIWLTALVETLPQAVDAQLKADAGVNLFEYTVLAMLSEEPDRTLPMSSLAAISFGSISRLSHAVTRLEKRGWVCKQSGEGARRHNTVSLTADGAEAITAVAGPHIAHVRQLVADPLTAAEVQSLTSIVRKLVAAANTDVSGLLDERIPEILDRNSGAV